MRIKQFSGSVRYRDFRETAPCYAVRHFGDEGNMAPNQLFVRKETETLCQIIYLRFEQYCSHEV